MHTKTFRIEDFNELWAAIKAWFARLEHRNPEVDFEIVYIKFSPGKAVVHFTAE